MKRIVDVGMDQLVVWNGEGDETMLVSHNFIDCVPLVCAATDQCGNMIPPFLLSHVSTDDKNYVPRTGHSALSEYTKQMLREGIKNFVRMSKEGMTLECSVVARVGRHPSPADIAVHTFLYEEMVTYQSARHIQCPRILIERREGGSVGIERGLNFKEGSFARSAWCTQRKTYVHAKVANTDDIDLPNFIPLSWNGQTAVYVPEKGENPYCEGDGVLEAIDDVHDIADRYRAQGDHVQERAALRSARAMVIGLSADLASSLYPGGDIRFPNCVPPEWGKSISIPAAQRAFP